MRIGWQKQVGLVFSGQTHHGCADVPQLLGYSVIQGLRRWHFGGAVAVPCKEMKDEKSLQSDPETPPKKINIGSGQLCRAVRSTCSRGRSPWRCSPPRRSRWWSELLLWDFWSSTSWARSSSSSKKVTFGKSGGLALCGWPQGVDCRRLRPCLVGGTGVKTRIITPQR